MTSKERATLRGQANTLEAIFQIGKGGINDNLISQLNETFTVRELIKVRVLLETCPQEPRELAHQVALATESEVVQVIGGIFVLYRKLEAQPKKVKAKKKIKLAKKGKVVRGLRQRSDDKEAFHVKKMQAKRGERRSK